MENNDKTFFKNMSLNVTARINILVVWNIYFLKHFEPELAHRAFLDTYSTSMCKKERGNHRKDDAWSRSVSIDLLPR